MVLILLPYKKILKLKNTYIENYTFCKNHVHVKKKKIKRMHYIELNRTV